MSRGTFGGTAGDFVASLGPGGSVRARAATLTLWTADTGGSQVTDLLLDGDPVTQIPVGNDGQVPEFQGPDGVSELWADAGGGDRVRLVPDIVGALASDDTAVAALLASPTSDTRTAADTATAADIATPGSATGAALTASIAEEVAPVAADLGELTASVGDVTHDPALRRWWAALGNRYTVAAQVLVFGDSNSEGTGATSFRKRWQALLQHNLRQRFPVAGVDGAAIPYITASPRQTPALADAAVVLVGSPATASWGLGRRTVSVGTGQSATFTFTGDRCKLMVTKGGAAATNRASIVLDGAPAVLVNTFNSGTLTGQVLWDSGALTPGEHTVAVSHHDADSGTVFLEGLVTYNGDTASGVRVVDGAKHGAQVIDFSGNDDWKNAVTNTGPYHLAVMAWGANESNAGVSAATYKTRLTDLTADLRGTGFAGSILLVGMPKRSEITDALWGEYLTAMEEIAAADADVAYLDLRSRMPDAGTAEATVLDLYADTVHFKPGAQGWIADEITRFIAPR